MASSTTQAPTLERIVRLALAPEDVVANLSGTLHRVPGATDGVTSRRLGGPTEGVMLVPREEDAHTWMLIDGSGRTSATIVASVRPAMDGSRVLLRSSLPAGSDAAIRRDAIALLAQGLHNLEASLIGSRSTPQTASPSPPATEASPAPATTPVEVVRLLPREALLAFAGVAAAAIAITLWRRHRRNART